MGAGASGFLLKRAAIDELIQAIRIVAKGAIYIDPTLAGKVLGSFIRQPGGGRGTPTGRVERSRSGGAAADSLGL